MNTPPTPKRYNPKFSEDSLVHRGPGGAAGAIKDEAVAALLAQLVSSFVHLEDYMGWVLAGLAGTDPTTAGYILRAIKSPRGRVDLLEALLQKAPRNREKGPEWDRLISDFWNVNKARNRYVHGHWWTDHNGKTWFAPTDEHGLSPFQATELEIADLQNTVDQVGTLLLDVVSVARGWHQARGADDANTPQE